MNAYAIIQYKFAIHKQLKSEACVCSLNNFIN